MPHASVWFSSLSPWFTAKAKRVIFPVPFLLFQVDALGSGLRESIDGVHRKVEAV
jgi:hypothetical protein